MENENMESTMAYGEEGIFKGYRSRSPSIDTASFRAISPLNIPPTDAASEIRLHDSVKVQGSLNMEEKSTENGAAELESGARKKITTDKGKQYEIQRLKERRTVALRHVTRQINKMKPLLVDLNNFEFVSSETEGLNNLLVKLQVAQDNFLEVLENESDIASANSWYEVHDGDVFKFKQSVCEYLSKAKELQSAELNSAASNKSHRSRKSNHSGRSNLSSLSSNAKLIKAKTRVAALEVETAFLKEKQALKMAEEQLELRKSLAKAKEEERIYEQMNSEEWVSTPTCLQTQKLPIFPVFSLLPANVTKDTNITSLSTPGSVVTMTTAAMVTSSSSSNAIPILEPASKSLPAHSSGNHVSGHQYPTRANPLSGYTTEQTGPIYTSPMTACRSGNSGFDFETHVDIVTPGCVVNPTEIPTSAHLSSTQPHFVDGRALVYSIRDQSQGIPQTPQHVYSPRSCSTSLSVNPLAVQNNTFQDIVDIQRKQTELSRIMVSQQARSLLPSTEPPMFYGDAMEFPAFMTAFESLIESKVEDSCERLYFLGQYTSGKAKEVINGCLQRKSEGSYKEAKGLLKRQFGDPFKIANAHITKLYSWQPIRANDGSALQNFYIALDQAKSAMKGMSHMDDLNTAHVLRQLWEKLPRHLRSKWTERNNKTKIEKGRIADFEEFSQFVRKQAELATDPVFSEENVTKPHHDEKDKGTHVKFRRRPRSRGKGTSLATGLKQEGRKEQSTSCSLCKRPHNLNDCEQFLKKTLTERWEFVVEKKLCFGCFSDQHIAKNCKERQTCKTCKRPHPTSLHDYDWVKKISNDSDNQPGAEPRVSSNRTAICSVTEAGDVPINMGILPVHLFHKSDPAKKIKVYALLDNASGGTFVSEKSMKALGIEGNDTDLILTTIHGTSSVTTKAIEGLVVANIKEEDVILDLPRTFTRHVIPADRNEIPRPDVICKMSHLKKISAEIPPYMADIEVGLLIGLNCPSALRPREIVYGKDSDPYAVRSLLGWYVNGPLCNPQPSSQITCNRINLSPEDTIITPRGYVVTQRKVKERITPQAVSQMFDLDFSEREKGTAMSHEDIKFCETVESGILHLDDLHYEMPLPFKHQNIQLPKNYAQAEKRLTGLKKRLKADDRYCADYCSFMADIISKGYARKVDDEFKDEVGRTWYLPHHGIYHPQKSKVRVVFDCSATFEGQSLNDKLLQGPDLTSNLLGVLTRFRQEKYAFMADIEKMFFQVRVRKEDQSFLRFLWWPNGDLEQKAEEYCMTVHLFGAVSSPACANYALQRTADENEDNYGTEVANTLRRNFYVDDVLKSASSEDKAIDLAKDVKAVCTNGGFNLTKFVGNTERIINSIPDEYRAENVKSLALGQDKLPIERALGVIWCIASDTFNFRIELKDKPCTRRGILSTISSIYDPLGFIAPVVLVGKNILQDICQSNSWDEPVDDATKSRWEKWRNELCLLESLKVPRSFKPAEFGKIVSAQLHCMSDASTCGYGQCSYLRLEDESGKVHVSFVMGKARVTPKKIVSIPRLELAAATISVNIGDKLKDELEYEDIKDYYWTDSKVVLGFISNESRRFHTYVANRVQLIHEHTTPSQWHYVETALNTADEGSRGMSPKDFVEKAAWITGPDFLKEPAKSWLKEETYEDHVDPDSPEVKNVKVNISTVKESSDIVKRLRRFSSWFKAKMAVALCLKYKRHLRDRVLAKRKVSSGLASDEGPAGRKDVNSTRVNVADLEEAEMEIIKHVQRNEFPSEIKSLQDVQEKVVYGSRKSDKEKKALFKRTTSLRMLDPVLDGDGVMRVGGRIRKANLPPTLKNPVILPKSSHISSLIISHTHHSGRGITLNELRSCGYWIVSGNAMVRQFISKCVTCRHLRGSQGEQKMADLPKSRVEPTPPFTYCGVDYFGPWHVQRGRSVVKRYGALFTCLASRAVHIEVADSLETDSFINALRRFISRRGSVREIRCDRGTNFIGAEAELKKAIEEMDDQEIKAELLKESIDWIKNPASASNFGGVWERQIRSIRNVMNGLIREHGSRLDEDSLRTFLCEAEYTINNRPLTVETLSDPHSAPPLSPSMLLTGKTRLVLPPPGEFKREDMYCRKMWRRTQHMAQEFWSRWCKEYLQQLQARNKWIRPRRNFQVGDVVLLKENQSPRNRWPMAKVVETRPDDQDQVRSVTVLTSNGSRLERPVNKLVLLVEA